MLHRAKVLAFTRTLISLSLSHSHFFPGALPTTAEFLRSIYKAHPAYQRDGYITPEMANDIMELADAIGMGQAPATVLEALVGDACITKLDARHSNETTMSVPLTPSPATERETPEALVVLELLQQNENVKI